MEPLFLYGQGSGFIMRLEARGTNRDKPRAPYCIRYTSIPVISCYYL